MKQIFLIILLYFLGEIILTTIFFGRHISIESQVVYSLFYLALILFLLKQLEFRSKNKKVIWFFSLMFIVINLVPISQGYISHDSGFVDNLYKLPQTKFGFPNSYLRIIDGVSESDSYNQKSKIYVVSSLIFNALFFIAVYLIFVQIQSRFNKREN